MVSGGIRAAAAALIGLPLAGCIDGERLSSIIDPQRTHTQETASTPLIQAFRGPLNTVFPVPPAPTAAGSSTAATGGASGRGKTFAEQMRLAAQKPEDHNQAKWFLKAGMALSDDLCAEWFQKLGRAQAINTANRDNLSALGSLTATLMGVANASSQAVGGVAGTFGFATAAINNEVTNFIVAPDIGIVRDTIDVGRGLSAADLDAGDFDFYQAYRALVRYDNSCSHLEVKRLVNESLKRTTDNKIKGTESTFFSTLVAGGTKELAKLFPPGSKIDERDVVALYGLYVRQVSDETVRKGLMDALTADKLADGQKVFIKQGTDEHLKSVLNTINALGDLDAKLDAVIADAMAKNTVKANPPAANP